MQPHTNAQTQSHKRRERETHTRTNTHTRARAHTHTCKQEHTPTHARAHTQPHTRRHMHARTHAHTRTHTRPHTHTHTDTHPCHRRGDCVGLAVWVIRRIRVRIIRRIRVRKQMRLIGVAVGVLLRRSAHKLHVERELRDPLRDPLRVAHRAALPAQHYRHCRHCTHYRRCTRPPAAPTAAHDWRGLCSGPSLAETALVGSGSLAEPHIATGCAVAAAGGTPSTRPRACSESRRRSVVGMGPTTRTRTFGHGADARPTAGGDDRTVPATSASDGGARTPTSLRKSPETMAERRHKARSASSCDATSRQKDQVIERFRDMWKLRGSMAAT